MKVYKYAPLLLTTILLATIALMPVFAQENKGLFKYCPEKRPQICYQLYKPVCAKIVTSNGRVYWKTFPNDCVACMHKEVVGYLPYPCGYKNIQPLPQPIREKIKEKLQHKGGIIEIRNGTVTVEKHVTIQVNNKTIEVEHSVYKNQTIMVIDHKVKVIVKDKVVVDKEFKRVIILKDNKSIEIPERVIDQIKQLKEVHKKRLKEILMKKFRKTFKSRLEVELENATYEMDVENNTVIVRSVIPVRARILWIFPITVTISAESQIDINTGIAATYIRKPWWWFLVTTVE